MFLLHLISSKSLRCILMLLTDCVFGPHPCSHECMKQTKVLVRRVDSTLVKTWEGEERHPRDYWGWIWQHLTSWRTQPLIRVSRNAALCWQISCRKPRLGICIGWGGWWGNRVTWFGNAYRLEFPSGVKTLMSLMLMIFFSPRVLIMTVLNSKSHFVQPGTKDAAA